MPPSARKQRGSCLPGASDTDLVTLFHELDTDANGELSLAELGRALQTNRDFARVCTGNPESRPLSAIAAGLVAQNIRNIADEELGDCDGSVSPEEFVLVCRRLMGMPASRPPAAGPSGASGKPKEAKATRGSIFGGFGAKTPKPPNPRESRAEAKLFGLQTMLREDVVGGLEALLVRARDAPDADSKASLYYEGVCAALAAARRLADTEDASSGTADNDLAEAEALELERLRRDLAAAKVAVANSEAAREAAEHQLRAQEEKRRRGNSFFG